MYLLLGFDKIVEQLIQKGADVNHVVHSNNNTALINAAYQGFLLFPLNSITFKITVTA